jgi:hypothetical protein
MNMATTEFGLPEQQLTGMAGESTAGKIFNLGYQDSITLGNAWITSSFLESATARRRLRRHEHFAEARPKDVGRLVYSTGPTGG